jgi:hypothetical protein
MGYESRRIELDDFPVKTDPASSKTGSSQWTYLEYTDVLALQDYAVRGLALDGVAGTYPDVQSVKGFLHLSFHKQTFIDYADYCYVISPVSQDGVQYGLDLRHRLIRSSLTWYNYYDNGLPQGESYDANAWATQHHIWWTGSGASIANPPSPTTYVWQPLTSGAVVASNLYVFVDADEPTHLVVYNKDAARTYLEVLLECWISERVED